MRFYYVSMLVKLLLEQDGDCCELRHSCVRHQKAVLITASVGIAFREAGWLGWDNSLHKGVQLPV